MDSSQFDLNDPTQAAIVASTPKLNITANKIFFGPKEAPLLEAPYTITGKTLTLQLPKGNQTLIFNDDFSGIISDDGKSAYVKAH